ncbi:predicted protein [Cyanophage PSS2]|uniref:structural protein n=1 Tax=Cyanophage PSS2 TaxID=658401 RepID=UPI0001B04019|nr:structural protein [Cyanophage PSS2]ACT65629.1 fiber protein [Cyanophage PSS2]ACY75771.1 predicted protein [Cyanophage PSS2]
MTTQIQFRRDTDANWATCNPTLASGELGYITDTGLFKIGDGITDWVSLSTFSGGGGGGGLDSSAVQAIIDTNTAGFQTAADVTAAINAHDHDDQGYFFQNSWYYENGRTHVGNPDTVVEADVDVDHDILFSCNTTGDFDNFMPGGLAFPYDRTTGLITMTGFQEAHFVQFRFNVDCCPDTDAGEMIVSLEVQRHNKSPFSIDESLAVMDNGAGVDYQGLATIPIFIGSMEDDGTGNPATVKPRVRLVNTGGDIKPRGFVMYAWT